MIGKGTAADAPYGLPDRLGWDAGLGEIGGGFAHRNGEGDLSHINLLYFTRKAAQCPMMRMRSNGWRTSFLLSRARRSLPHAKRSWPRDKACFKPKTALFFAFFRTVEKRW